MTRDLLSIRLLELAQALFDQLEVLQNAHQKKTVVRWQVTGSRAYVSQVSRALLTNYGHYSRQALSQRTTQSFRDAAQRVAVDQTDIFQRLLQCAQQWLLERDHIDGKGDSDGLGDSDHLSLRLISVITDLWPNGYQRLIPLLNQELAAVDTAVVDADVNKADRVGLFMDEREKSKLTVKKFKKVSLEQTKIDLILRQCHSI